VHKVAVPTFFFRENGVLDTRLTCPRIFMSVLSIHELMSWQDVIHSITLLQ
jgi:hypothetical protein